MTTQEPDTTWPHELTPGGETFKKRVDNPAVFRAYMFAKMPTLGITTAYLERIDVTECAVALPYGWMTKDLFGRISSAAIVAAAEACSVSLLVLNIRNQGAQVSPRPRAVTVENMEEAREDLLFEVEDGTAYGAFVAEAIAHGDEVSRDVTVLGRAASSGRLVARVHIEWVLEPK